MPDHHTSVVYHLAQPGQFPPGRLIHAQDRPGAIADVYLHPLHVRSDLVWDLNWLNRQQVGYGLWRQRWTAGGRMLEPAEGLGYAESRWEIVPAAAMPRGRTVVPVEEEGGCTWLIRAGYCTAAARDEMNGLLARIAGDGLWLQHWYSGDEGRPWPDAAPPLQPPALSLLV